MRRPRKSAPRRRGGRGESLKLLEEKKKGSKSEEREEEGSFGGGEKRKGITGFKGGTGRYLRKREGLYTQTRAVRRKGKSKVRARGETACQSIPHLLG